MKATRVWFEGERIYIETDDGRTLWQSILYYQRLKNATDEQRNDYELKRLTRIFPMKALNMKIRNQRVFHAFF